MEKTLKSLASVSLFFLIVVGGTHLSATFLLVQGAENETLALLFKSLDLPFLLSALLYGSAQFSLLMQDATGKGKPAFIASCVLSVFVLSTALFINFAFPDVQLFG